MARVRLSVLFWCFVIASTPDSLPAQSRAAGPWWPHPLWGRDDQAGASNWITEAKVLESISLVRTGKVYDLGHVYDDRMPILGRRSYSLTIPGIFGPAGRNSVVWFDEMVTGQMGQVGTQFDGLGHPGVRLQYSDGSTHDVFYNGFTASEIHRPYGLLRLGVEQVRPIISRGILVDIAGLKDTPVLPNSYEITLEDVRAALSRQNILESSLRPGDVVLFRSGWSAYWNDPHKYNTQWPGIGLEVARWLVEKQVALVGDDGVGVEPYPNSDPNLADPVHIELTTKNGIFLLENLALDGLAADRAYEFLFIFVPLPLRGATGSPGRPIAIR